MAARDPEAAPAGHATATADVDAELDAARLAAIEERYDESGGGSRPQTPALAAFLKIVAVAFAAYHYLTAGFGLPVDHWHMGWHLSGLFVLIYASYPLLKTARARELRPSALRPGNVPLFDWALMILGIASALFLGLAWRGIDWLGVPEQTFRQGNPTGIDVFFGTALIVLVLDIARRTLGWVLPAIIGVFMAYALFGPHIPVQILQHPGVDWRQFVNNMYFPSEGIFGVTLWVVSTIVFHFVLFGVIAQRTGLGQLFIDNAMILAGRYTGGPAKVSVISSAFFGTISGSSVANTVSTGSLTIPNMKRLGYPGHFAGGVEAAASAGGQITPPIMGAAAFCGISLCVIVGIARWNRPLSWALPIAFAAFVLWKLSGDGFAAPMAITLLVCAALALLNPQRPMPLAELGEAVATGARYALAVGAASAAVGIVVGVINTTGIGFRLGFMVTSGAATIAAGIHELFVFGTFELVGLLDLQLFISLVLIAVACVMMGAGVPTTALYIMLVSVAQPALAQLGVPPIASHLFVLYYGVISEITPPVCTSAYAAAAIAGSNPFRTGISAFGLGLGKVVAPMAFVYAPVLLIVSGEPFSLVEFLHVAASCLLGVAALSGAVVGFLFARMGVLERILCAVAGLVLLAPSWQADLVGLALLAPPVLRQVMLSRGDSGRVATA